MLSEFKDFIAKHSLVSENERILVAVSGGVDSMCLLDLLRKSGYHIGVAHINHGIRGEESDADQALCEHYCKTHKIPYFFTKLDLRDIEQNFQEIAREKRKGFLVEVLKKNQYSIIATGHHKDDEVENLFLRLNRSAGLKGLSGMEVKSGMYIKPLLFATKKEIEAYCKNENVPYRIDASNASSKYDRNFIRNEVLPLLSSKFPNFLYKSSKSIQYLKESNELEQYTIESLMDRCISPSEGDLKLNMGQLAKYPNIPYVFYQIMKKWDLNRSESDNLYTASTGVVIEKNETRFLKNRNEIVIRKKEESTNPVGSTYKLHEYEKEVVLSNGDLIRISINANKDAQSANSILLDKKMLTYPLIIRRRQNGDIFYPKGLNMKRKKLKKYFTDEKFSRFDKDETWILTDEKDQIIWIIGHRQDQRFVSTMKSECLVRIDYIPSVPMN